MTMKFTIDISLSINHAIAYKTHILLLLLISRKCTPQQIIEHSRVFELDLFVEHLRYKRKSFSRLESVRT